MSPRFDSTTISLIERMNDPLTESTKTKVIAQISERIGGLSAPSKMPGYGWSIPAQRCITGSKLRQVPGTACSLCYACKGRYGFPVVHDAMEKRYRGWVNDPDWVLLMSVAIRLSEPNHFRWFDSGDLQSSKMFADIVSVVENTDPVRHWLPTQERGLVNWEAIPTRLVVRLSATKLNGVPHPTYPSSSVSTDPQRHIEGIYLCPSRAQENKCGACRACWDPTVAHVLYSAH